MDSELSALEAKVEQAVAQLKQLREEGRELRQQVAARADENVRLTEKLAAAKTRIEALLKQIPESEA
jgi:cell division protein ZapB